MRGLEKIVDSVGVPRAGGVIFGCSLASSAVVACFLGRWLFLLPLDFAISVPALGNPRCMERAALQIGESQLHEGLRVPPIRREKFVFWDCRVLLVSRLVGEQLKC